MQLDATKGPVSAGPLFDAVARAVSFATGAVLVALVTLVCLEAFLRGAFNYSLGFAEELTGYGVVFMTFFGAALALRSASMFQVHFLLDSWPGGTRRWLIRAFALVALLICVILAWKTKDLTLSSFNRGKFAPTVLRTPLWIPQIILPVGFTVLAFFLVEQILLTFRKSED
ncbi:TRAP transporter small permease [Tropicibacter naphthalenivorans]|uniref:TRAP transporter small permease protein n=1 Tax=Tropicibacter naphthalenivorans TaxID=441103 RepID=A0A0P1GJU3_9RHOB|nr:TRAP transporter small permease [Tropicibacter naphthalenivorans]CUH82230.1 2,3-diketo-L-gulonate TRAP transporter small permease protein YiaM [Tropicibacter naphthalenivorans]SMD04865.1 TRAP-type C4-dicarboxylate transport system, small permease component [Tropicibacter naphthalenivorans]